MYIHIIFYLLTPTSTSLQITTKYKMYQKYQAPAADNLLFILPTGYDVKKSWNYHHGCCYAYINIGTHLFFETTSIRYFV